MCRVAQDLIRSTKVSDGCVGAWLDIGNNNIIGSLIRKHVNGLGGPLIESSCVWDCV